MSGNTPEGEDGGPDAGTDRSAYEQQSEGSAGAQSGAPDDSPEWADGLKQLYDSVVDEPLPDSFLDLLSKLDADGDTGQLNGDSPDQGGAR